MYKAIGVAAMLAVAATVAAPAHASPTVAEAAPVAVVATVPVEADALAVVDFERPVVATVAAPEPETVAVVAAEPVEAVALPVATQPAVESGGPMAETESAVEPAVEPTVEPVAPVVEPVATEPAPEALPEPNPTEVLPLAVEGQSIGAYDESRPEFWQYNIDPATGEVFAGAHVGSYYAKSIDYWNGQPVVVKQQDGVTMHPDADPMGTNVLYVFHVFEAAAQ